MDIREYACQQKNALIPIRESTVVVMGAARNISRTLKAQIKVFRSALSEFKKLYIVVVESDSEDTTLRDLAQIAEADPCFHYITLGKLSPSFPLRTHRIAAARNAAIDFCIHHSDLRCVDYVIVADLDGVNLGLTTNSFSTTWQIGSWDVATANQPHGYYDIWALRHSDWCPGNCWSDFTRLTQTFPESIAQQLAIASRRISIPRNHRPIYVDSAFGGLAIYRGSLYFSARYSAGADSEECCEHVAFHAQLKANGATIIIAPNLVNIESHHRSLSFWSKQRLVYTLKRWESRLFLGRL